MKLPAWLSVQSAWTYALAHKITTGVAVVVVLGGGYFAWHAFTGASVETKYVIGSVERGTVVSVVSGSGQVSANREVALDAKASGELTGVNVTEGQAVHAGQLIASIDPGTSGFELENARLSYEKTVSDSAKSASDASQDVDTSYQSARSELASVAADLTDAVDTLDALHAKTGYLAAKNYESNSTEEAYGSASYSAFSKAENDVHDYLETYHAADLSQSADVDSLLSNAHDIVATLAAAAKRANDAVVYLRAHGEGSVTMADAAYTSTNQLVSTLNSDVTSVAGAVTTIADAKHTLADESGGTGSLDVRSEQLSLSEKQDAYNDHFITAPFDGIIAKVSAKTGDTVNSGTAVATIVTTEELADITLNEVDVAKVKVGQKATLTFDAIDGLSISGTVAGVEGVGTVSQGVVSYGVTIAFDTQDDRVKPGMTANADIQSEVADNVLMVPVGAVKTAAGESYVLVPPSGTEVSSAAGVTLSTPPEQVAVETGLSDGTNIEITSGLAEGDIIIVRSITASATKSPAASAAGRTGATPVRTNATFGGRGFGG